MRNEIAPVWPQETKTQAQNNAMRITDANGAEGKRVEVSHTSNPGSASVCASRSHEQRTNTRQKRLKLVGPSMYEFPERGAYTGPGGYSPRRPWLLTHAEEV